jgi:hypothetical protein
MKRQQARHNGINRIHDALHYSKNSGAPMTLACLHDVWDVADPD